MESPLVAHAQLHGVLVRSSLDWELWGRQAWADAVAALNARPSTRRVIGFDSEWFNKNPLATVQIATSTHCFVIHLSYLNDRLLPEEVRRVLEDPTVIKCGVAVSSDASRLRKEQQVSVASVMDVDKHAVLLGLTEFGKTNLAALASSVCSVTMEKRKSITRSNWELPLSPAQIAYAADDAVASYMVADRIMEEAVRRMGLEDGGSTPFVAAQWLSYSSRNAQIAFKQASRAHSAALAETRGAAQPCEGGGATGENGQKPMMPPSNVRVRVLSKDGQPLFDCSQARAKFYVKEHGIAVVTKQRADNPMKPLEIQLLFHNQNRTRLCVYAASGQCDFGEHCPFAHGVEQLSPESRELLTSLTVHSCAFCLGQSKLMRHAIVPPSFRRYLPKPLRWPGEDAYVPICTQCNTLVRHYYDYFMDATYREAEEADAQGKVPMGMVAKCVGYARLLLSEEKLARVPVERQEELRRFIREHWTVTRLCGSDGLDSHTPAPVAVGQADATDAEGAKRVDELPEGDPVAEHADTEAAVAGHATNGFNDDWESLEADETVADKPKQGPWPTQECRPAQTHLVDVNGARIPVYDETGGLNRAFLERLARVVPGDVRARATMATLVGRDVAKAEAFVQRWRAFCRDECGMIEKPSNSMTAEDWAAYAAAKGSAKGARGARGRVSTSMPEGGTSQ